MEKAQLNKLALEYKEQIIINSCRKHLLNFSKYQQADLQIEEFHRNYYKILDMFAHGKIKKLMITAPPQHGKALYFKTPILTKAGFKEHGELQLGDYVIGENGKWVKVLLNHGNHVIESSRVIMSSKEELIASNQHEWVVYCDREKYRKKGQKTKRRKEILETKDLLIKQRRNPAIKADIKIKGRKQNLPIDPYILGCWLGDGHSRQGVLTVGKEDIEHFKKLGEHREVKPGIYRVLIESLSKLLRINNLILNKHIPEIYFKSSIEQRFELLRGLMDTDGYIDSRGNCEFTQKESSLANQVYLLIRTLGIKPSINTYPATLNGKVVGNKQRICFRTNELVFGLKRKLDLIPNSNRKDSKFYFIKKVEPIGLKEVNCIEVEGGVYLAGKSLILTHNSEGSSRKLPSFMLGLNPDLRIAIGSYASTIAQDFNRDCQKIIDSEEYRNVFPNIRLNGKNLVTIATGYKRNSTVFEIVDKKGSLRAIGRGGGLTSKTVDIMILDDVYKDYAEGNSPVIREQAWKWYTSVVKTRLHNDSQELIVFTRWNEDDLIGRIGKKEQIIEVKSFADLENIPEGAWIKINYEAIKTTLKTELDSREKGEALWEKRHSIIRLNEKKNLDKHQFDCLYQGNPSSKEGSLYSEFKIYTNIEEYGIIIGKGNYTDVADTGDDKLCSVSYDLVRGKDIDNKPIKYALVTDIVHTQEHVEETSESVPMMLNRTGTRYSNIESNNGGRTFALMVRKKVKLCKIDWFHQGGNKESRILTNASLVNVHIIMPVDWKTRWPDFYEDIDTFKKTYVANKYKDAADVLTGIVEKDILGIGKSKGIKRRN